MADLFDGYDYVELQKPDKTCRHCAHRQRAAVRCIGGAGGGSGHVRHAGGHCRPDRARMRRCQVAARRHRGAQTVHAPIPHCGVHGGCRIGHCGGNRIPLAAILTVS